MQGYLEKGSQTPLARGSPGVRRPSSPRTLRAAPACLLAPLGVSPLRPGLFWVQHFVFKVESLTIRIEWKVLSAEW